MAGRASPTLKVLIMWNLSAGLSMEDDKAGYSLLEQDGTPKPAFRALESVLGPGAGTPTVDPSALWDRLLAPAAPATILAPDTKVHLGDSE